MIAKEITDLCAFGERGWVKSLSIMAEAMDRRELELERCRVALGFGADWSPAYDRTQKVPPATPVGWADKYGMLNGMGGLTPLMQEMAVGLDVIEAKLAEVIEALTDPEPKRGPGRPRKVA